MTKKFEKIKKEIEKIISKSPLGFDLGHARKTLEWVLKLKPNADEFLQISALAHDIDRPITGITEGTHLKSYAGIKKFKNDHAKRSAKITAELMKKYNYNYNDIKKVQYLIENHEQGGNKQANILKDADSIAYFDYNIEPWYKINGKVRTKGKIKFMLNRVSKKAKLVIKNLEYKNQTIKKLIDEAK